MTADQTCVASTHDQGLWGCTCDECVALQDDVSPRCPTCNERECDRHDDESCVECGQPINDDPLFPHYCARCAADEWYAMDHADRGRHVAHMRKLGHQI